MDTLKASRFSQIITYLVQAYDDAVFYHCYDPRCHTIEYKEKYITIEGLMPVKESSFNIYDAAHILVIGKASHGGFRICVIQNEGHIDQTTGIDLPAEYNEDLYEYLDLLYEAVNGVLHI